MFFAHLGKLYCFSFLYFCTFIQAIAWINTRSIFYSSKCILIVIKIGKFSLSYQLWSLAFCIQTWIIISWKNVCRLSFECLQGFTFLPFLLVIVYLISSLRMYHFLSINTIYIVLYNTTWSAINNLMVPFIFVLSIHLFISFATLQVINDLKS